VAVPVLEWHPHGQASQTLYPAGQCWGGGGGVCSSTVLSWRWLCLPEQVPSPVGGPGRGWQAAAPHTGRGQSTHQTACHPPAPQPWLPCPALPRDGCQGFPVRFHHRCCRGHRLIEWQDWKGP